MTSMYIMKLLEDVYGLEQAIKLVKIDHRRHLNYLDIIQPQNVLIFGHTQLEKQNFACVLMSLG